MPVFYNFINNRENLVAYSTYEGTVTWINNFPAGATITTGITAPDGTNTAIRFTCNNTTNALLRVNFPSFTPNGTDTYTTSFFVRRISGTGSAFTDLADGSPSVDYSSQLITNQWVRVTTSGVPTATAKSFIDLYSDNNTNLVLDFWGVQIERKSSAGVYVPTYGSIVTGNDGLTYSFDNVFVPADLFREGNLWTWGTNSDGRLGDNTTTGKLTPITTFAGGTNWKQLSCGDTHTAAIKTDGTLWLWGSNNTGQLGDSTTTNKLTPVTTFAGGNNWKQVNAGGYRSTVAIKTDGTLWSWGRGFVGQMGNAATDNKSTPVTTFTGGTNWKQVTAGRGHIAAIKTDGTLWVWGDGSFGRLGINATGNRSTPVTTFAGGTNWSQISNGGSFSTAIKTDGTLWTWGYNTSAQLGNNSNTNVSTPITKFAGGTNWKQVSGGGYHTAAIKTDGTLWTWGRNYEGQLGITRSGAGNDASTPVTTFAGGTNWKQVGCSGSNICRITIAIKTDGTLWTWGDNSNGQQGINGSGTSKSTPITTFAGGTNWKQVSSGDRFSVALTYIDPVI